MDERPAKSTPKLNQAELKERAKVFAEQHYESFETKRNSNNPVVFYFCCQAFCGRGADYHHDDSSICTYAAMRKFYKFSTEEEFAHKLYLVLKKLASSGRTIVGPSYNTVHFEDEEESEDKGPLKMQIVQVGQEKISLEKQLSEKGDEITQLEMGKDELLNASYLQEEQLNALQHENTRNLFKIKRLESKLALLKKRQLYVDFGMYHCEACKKTIPEDRLKKVEQLIAKAEQRKREGNPNNSSNN